jgi:Cu-Zn family superoxide dismutase
MKKSGLILLFLSLSQLAYAQESIPTDGADSSQVSKPTPVIENAYANIINNSGKVIGRATFRQGSEGVIIRIKASDLTPGAHGLHFHETRDCNDHSHFDQVKGHIVTHERMHGFLHEDGPHEADLPNLIVHDDGTVHVELYSNMVSLAGLGWKPELLDNDGSSLVIHEHADDYISQPSGNSGGRIACGSILAGIPQS